MMHFKSTIGKISIGRTEILGMSSVSVSEFQILKF